MNLKLNHSEFTAMLQMFVSIVLVMPSQCLADTMLKALLMQIYEKLYRHAIHTKSKYSIKITIPEAIAFYLFWAKHEFKKPSSYEANLIRQTINSIHQKLAA